MAPPIHATWVYGFDGPEWMTPVEIDRMVRLGLSDIFLSIGKPTESLASTAITTRLAAFLAKAHQVGISVHAISNDQARSAYLVKGTSDISDPDVAAKRQAAVDQVNAILTFNTGRVPEERFDGIHINVEPHSPAGSAWTEVFPPDAGEVTILTTLTPAERDGVLLQYCALIKALCAAAKHPTPPRLPLTTSATIAWWYCTIRTNYPKNTYTIDLIDTLAGYDLDAFVDMIYSDIGDHSIYLGNPARPDLVDRLADSINQVASHRKQMIAAIGGWYYDTYFPPSAGLPVGSLGTGAVLTACAEITSGKLFTKVKPPPMNPAGTAVFAYRFLLPLADPFITPWGLDSGSGPKGGSPAIWVENGTPYPMDVLKSPVVPNDLRAEIKNFGGKTATKTRVTFAFAPWSAGFSDTDFKVIPPLPHAGGTPALYQEIDIPPAADKTWGVANVSVPWILDPDDDYGGVWARKRIKHFDHFCVKVIVESASAQPQDDLSTMNNRGDQNFADPTGKTSFLVGNPTGTRAELLLRVSPLPAGFHASISQDAAETSDAERNSALSRDGSTELSLALDAGEKALLDFDFVRPAPTMDIEPETDVVADVTLETAGHQSAISARLWMHERAQADVG